MCAQTGFTYSAGQAALKARFPKASPCFIHRGNKGRSFRTFLLYIPAFRRMPDQAERANASSGTLKPMMRA